jgi:hypothetical protein
MPAMAAAVMAATVMIGAATEAQLIPSYPRSHSHLPVVLAVVFAGIPAGMGRVTFSQVPWPVQLSGQGSGMKTVVTRHDARLIPGSPATGGQAESSEHLPSVREAAVPGARVVHQPQKRPLARESSRQEEQSLAGSSPHFFTLVTVMLQEAPVKSKVPSAPRAHSQTPFTQVPCPLQ